MTEQQLKEMVILPRDPVAYPIHPKRSAQTRRPAFLVVEPEPENPKGIATNPGTPGLALETWVPEAP